MSEKCTVENYVFVLPYGSKIIDCYYTEEKEENRADRYMGKSAKDAKTAFEAIKKFKPIPSPPNLRTYCEVTDLPCDPNTWFCHRQFVAIRFFNDRPGSRLTKGCHLMRTKGPDWIETLRRTKNSSTCVLPIKLDWDITTRALIVGCGRHQAYSEYAQSHYYLFDC